MPNNRQWAFIFWVAVFLVWIASRRDMRSSVQAVLRRVSTPKLLVPLLVLSGWVAGLAYLGTRVRLWDGDRLTDTIMWFVTAGLVLFGNLVDVSKERGFFRRKALATLEVSALVGVLSEVFVLYFIAELILQPFLALLAGVSVVASHEAQHKQVKKLIDGLLATASVGLVLHAIVSLVNNWSSIDKGDLAREFALPVWLTIGVLPYIYALGLWAAYEQAFMRIGWKAETSRWAQLRGKLVLLASFHLKAREVGSFSGPWQFRLAQTSSFRDARRVIHEFRHEQQEAVREAIEAEARLVRYAGVDGVDGEGRRLDRREFDETTDALRWLATCHMGWYRRNNRYRDDLLDLLTDDFTKYGLPQPSGITMHVSAGGNAWYAWRRTISGWVFAIGAAGPPPDQWEYDGPIPPSGFPGEDPAWGTGPFGGEVNRNW